MNSIQQQLADFEKQIPARLGWGKGFAGPGFPGCVNTGRRAMVAKSEYLHGMSNGALVFAVGPDLYAFEQARQYGNALFNYYNGHASRGDKKKLAKCKALCKDKGVTFYKTYAAAKRALLRLQRTNFEICARMLADDKAERKMFAKLGGACNMR